ncbi:MAG: transglycosylase domain-containing protein [Bacteriovoracaceae bacterium]|nr:transglycosylase domain-containing protein [Bacteriovoracaceae bacterium]
MRRASRSKIVRFLRWWTIGRFIAAIIVFIILTPLIMYYSHDVSKLNTQYPQVILPETLEDDADYEWVQKPPKYWVRLDQISQYAKWAIILSEDWGFYEHHGVDFDELKKAVDQSVREKRMVRGASTISQQVVKNVFLSSNRSIVRKVHEIILTQKMEEAVSKKRILETYFNIVELGPKVYGIKNASFYYFKKHPSALNPREAAFIAMLLPSPKRYSKSFRNRELSRFARSRIRAILIKLRWARIINEEQRQMWNQTKFSWEK